MTYGAEQDHGLLPTYLDLQARLLFVPPLGPHYLLPVGSDLMVINQKQNR